MGLLDSTFKLRSDVRHRRVHQEGVVVRQQDPEVITLNDVGTRVLELIAAGLSVKDMLDVLEQEYEVGREQLSSDVYAYTNELLDADVIERADLAD